ncbi:MAG: hypothetical protein IJ189_14210 [Clostridia bacterium]|nr:hypothetical protein [Clostridia bacterium]
MQCIEEFPETCRRSIKTIAEKLDTDYDTAYAMICLEAILWDLYPSDTVIVSMILKGSNRSENVTN